MENGLGRWDWKRNNSWETSVAHHCPDGEDEGPTTGWVEQVRLISRWNSWSADQGPDSMFSKSEPPGQPLWELLALPPRAPTLSDTFLFLKLLYLYHTSTPVYLLKFFTPTEALEAQVNEQPCIPHLHSQLFTFCSTWSHPFSLNTFSNPLKACCGHHTLHLPWPEGPHALPTASHPVLWSIVPTLSPSTQVKDTATWSSHCKGISLQHNPLLRNPICNMRFLLKSMFSADFVY